MGISQDLNGGGEGWRSSLWELRCWTRKTKEEVRDGRESWKGEDPWVLLLTRMRELLGGLRRRRVVDLKLVDLLLRSRRKEEGELRDEMRSIPLLLEVPTQIS